ncbi:nephrocystin-4 isoform X4 [Clupea harengus]|uniref:Nephrocystin-4 isoform X4 n=1 Tax=Clupea harengus TaxID=7950 RepID=A0A6P8FG54_CLUHA|nr:nephrocystin-4 isoform X4 [Clupea harengus]
MTDWREVFERTRAVPPHSQTARQADKPSQGFQLSFKHLDGASVFQKTSSFQLRVSFFDTVHRHFFGRTWRSPPHDSTAVLEHSSKVAIDEVVYFHTALLLPCVVAVVELVSLGSQHAIGRGFGILQLFSGASETPLLSGSQRMPFYGGTPRALLTPGFRDVELNGLLTVMDGVQLLYTLQPHPALLPIMHLFPQNTLVSDHTSIPGLMQMSDNTACLRKPRVLKSVSCLLDRLVLLLSPSLERFEQDLLHLLTADSHNTHRIQEGPTLMVQERRLHVGVHNGWTFLDGPQVLVLELGSTGGPRGRSGSFRQTSGGGLSSPSPALILRGGVELKMAVHPAFTLIFQLEYVFSSLTASEGRLSSSSRVAFLQCLGWAAWSPFSGDGPRWSPFSGDGPRAQEVQLQLQGGVTPNPSPFSVMVYSTPCSNNTEVKDGGIHLSFQFSAKDEKPKSSPALAKRKHAVSPPRDESIQELHASPSRSAQGPGLSISQLAATSRYPTLSHSTGSPWQQSIPSRLHPSPLASTHQLSHVDRLGVSSIVHLEMSVKELQDPLEDDEPHLQELAFTPIHAPVIILGTHTTCLPTRSSRSSLAHLFSAGFPEVTDLSGQVAQVLDSSEPLNFNPHREEADPLQSNTLILHFLAFSRIPQTGVPSDWPRCIYFTFQLYRFPPVTTQHLRLIGPPPPHRKSTDDYPCVLSVINMDGTVNSADSPGLQLRFPVGAEVLRPGEKRWFLRYLAQNSLQIDVWDSDSRMLIGSAAVELKHLLRQGRSAVQIVHELEVITTEFAQDANMMSGHLSGHLSGHTVISPINIFSTAKGRLHLRLGNVGGPVDWVSSTPPVSVHCVVQASSGTGGFGGGSLFSSKVSHINARNAARALRMVEVHGDLASVVWPGGEQAGQGEEEETRLRKLNRMAAVRHSEHKGGATEHKPYMWRREERQRLSRDLRVIEAYREQSKAEGIANILSQAITTHHTLYTTLGTAEFFEFGLKNPFNLPQTITIHSEDPELSVVVSTEEWRCLKQRTKTVTPLEEGLFKLDQKTLVPQVYMRPKEALYIPLKYQTFVSPHTPSPQGRGPLRSDQSHHVFQKLQSSDVTMKSIKVHFQGQDGKPVAICQVRVELTPHVVDQTFRFSHPERTFLKKSIRLPPWTPAPEEAPVPHVRCSDPSVICETRAVPPGEPQDVYIRVDGCPSPQIKKFFISVFTDRWLAAPAQIWQVYINFVQRLDISCVTGQLTCQSLVLRGTQAMRKVKCHVSHPLELQVDPAEVFVLPPRAVQDLQLRVCCCRAGRRFIYLNVVDVQQHQLVETWLISLSSNPPVISKAFEMCVPVGGGRGSTKKITYTNPYPDTRTLHLLSDHADLLQFKEDTFQVEGGQTYSIGLRLAPSHSPGQEEILIYVNNKEERNEETFSVKVVYR